ncbi:MAG: peptidyl-alpha-hydroxyglycine alpha-amidating lyase family protein [Gemmatimonadota bacterium]
MSGFDRIQFPVLALIALAVAGGCGGTRGDTADGDMDAAADSMAGAAMAADTMPFDLPPSGTTGTPADAVTDPALTNLANPNPTVVTDWADLPGGREWGSTAGVDIGPDGHVWAYDRCGGGLDGGCDSNPTYDPVVKYDRNTGELLASFGAGIFETPHGLHVDSVGNVWVTDYAANDTGTKGHQVIKFSPTGDILMRLGVAGTPGNDSEHFNQPTDVITAPNGDIFVADGHSGQGQNPAPGSTGRIMKFSPDGRFIMQWGRIGNGPAEFRTPHALAFDSRGRLHVADRGNHRIQIFDQNGSLLDTYYQYSRISDIFITPDDMLYAIDSETSPTNHPGWISGIRIGSAFEDRVTAFIPPHEQEGDARPVAGEGVAVDADGSVYAAEGPASRPVAGGGLTKYVRGM